MRQRPKAAVLALALVWATAAPARADGGSAQFRGYTEVNRLVKERVAQINGFELGQYLGEARSEPSTNGGLLALLGTYLGGDTDAEYRNGDPNSVNMVLWYIMLDGLASDIAAACAPQPAPPQSGGLALLPEFKASLQPLCAWPADSARTDDALYGFWTALMSFDAPPEEFQAWKQFFLTAPEYAAAPASQAIPAMALAILYNPYFLLRN